TWSPSGGAAPMNPASPPSLRTWKAPAGSSPAAAPAGREVTSAGMSTSAQCQKPDGVGASGSKQVTTKLCVPSGAPLQLSCGEVLPPAATWSCLSGWPSVTSALVTVNDATAGSRSYGLGATGRSRVIGPPGRVTDRTAPILAHLSTAHAPLPADRRVRKNGTGG